MLIVSYWMWYRILSWLTSFIKYISRMTRVRRNPMVQPEFYLIIPEARELWILHIMPTRILHFYSTTFKQNLWWLFKDSHIYCSRAPFSRRVFILGCNRDVTESLASKIFFHLLDFDLHCVRIHENVHPAHRNYMITQYLKFQLLTSFTESA